MAIGNDGAVVRHFRTLYSVGTLQERSDGQLLEQFATDRDEAAELAFAVLVERHGPMVLRVCRSVLADPHDSQDAFQATFLVLVREARALWVRDSLGPWLHQVAYRTAACTRSAIARRRRHERRAARPEHTPDVEPAAELERLLHYEIDRLPERYRAPVVLCDLEGRSHEQAARHLGWPVGTVKSRLSRGRERLRSRLLKSGVSPNAGLIATALSFDGPMASFPASLANSTAYAATRFLTAQTIVRRAASLLAQGVLRSMFITQLLKTGSILLAVGAAVAGVGLLAEQGTSGAQPQDHSQVKGAAAADAEDFIVKAGKLKVAVIERGSLESANIADVVCDVEGGAAIVRIVDEGTRVRKGDVVCELDSARLSNMLTDQRVSTGVAKAAYETAKLAREIAELAVIEYADGIFKHDLNTLKREVSVARSAIEKTETRLERTRRALARPNGSPPKNGDAKGHDEIVIELDLEDRLEGIEQALLRKKGVFELVRSKLELLETYSLRKTTKSLQIDVQGKLSDELAKRAAWERETSKESKLKRQVAACTLVAPLDGVVGYGEEASQFADRQHQSVDGTTVRHGRKIVTIADLSRIQALVKLPESIVDRIEPKMRARLRVDAFPNELLTGTVLDVAPRPDRSNFNKSGFKVYPTHVEIDQTLPGLRPGMTAQAEIPIGELDNVLSVPHMAVLAYDGKYHVAVKKPGGGVEWRDVSLGLANDAQVEVWEGIKSGETVIVNPTTLMSEEERKAKLGNRPRVRLPKRSPVPAIPPKNAP